MDAWIQSRASYTLTDPIGLSHTRDLYTSLPTRDGTRTTYVEPKIGAPLPHGHHLAFFGARKPEPLLRDDGTDEDVSPPSPFTKRMWVGGTIHWDTKQDLVIGEEAVAHSSVHSVERKRFEEGRPMLFVTQRMEITQNGNPNPAIVEDRAHVYFHADIFAKRKKIFDRPVPNIPVDVDFSLNYTPTPVTLFRYSALMWNAHHIHLDKEYCQKVEGYPERLVHGPLTATMLLEAVNFHHPGVKIAKFQYRATNPLFVNDALTINGKWTDKNTIKVWCQDSKGIVGMTSDVVVV